MKKLWIKDKEYVLYIIFGGLTTVVNYAVFLLMGRALKLEIVLANAIAWIFAVAFAYITNRIWVFESKAKGAKNVLLEIGEFVAGRLITLGIESLLLWIFVDLLSVNDLVMKIVTSIITIVVNYIFSQFIIFRGKDQKSKAADTEENAGPDLKSPENKDSNNDQAVSGE